ncbi:cyclase [Mycobacterium sp. ACS4331]|nr:adenylate/guanylate cyclase domain-containing protein [Mycobacterium sp. ACS4331]OBF21720.1 cyclase [Mycobacterium sp. ACS4331]
MTGSPTCGSCGTQLRVAAKFCDACGVPTAAPAEGAEYKQVTVLFADVVRSMAIAAALDVERYREIITELVQRAAAVVRRFGGSAEYTGDGVMAIFGAPVALEDHAFRGCLAALAIQDEATQLAAEVARRDGVTLSVRVGLNSGQIIAGEIGSGPLGYRATGIHVGMAQRMESVAPPGGVMLSESTARLVEHLATLGEPEPAHIKGADGPVRVRRLLSADPPRRRARRAEAGLVGRRWEMAALSEHLDRTADGRGCVTHVVGTAGIGKTRIAREAAKLATGRGIRVAWVYCESHTRDIPFHAVAGLLREGIGITGLDHEAARARVRDRLTWADPHDLALLDDLLGITGPDTSLPAIDPDARRRRLTALVTTATLARTEPELMIVEDAHWIDPVSDSLLTDFLAVVSKVPLMVLITARPEYRGALTRLPGAETITLSPLSHSDIAALLTDLLGTDPSLGELSVAITERAAGNSFFAEEMVRELAQRGVLAGKPGHYVCHADISRLSVPETVQAAIEARIDRLTLPAKRAVNAASVIGDRFDAALLTALGVDTVPDELMAAGLVDQVRSTPQPEYAFRHPLIRAVAYESQLRSTRAESHRLLAAAIRERDPATADENAALIAEHLEAAGELPTAFAWHMRAGAWLADRDISAAQSSWERARQVADALPDDDPQRHSMRVTPRALLCGIAWRVHMSVTGERFDELRQLCTAAGDKAALATGMAGLVLDHALRGRIVEASELASETWTLIESIGDPALIVGLSFPLIYAKGQNGAWGHLLEWSQRVITVADGDPSIGSFMFGCPLALAFTTRAVGRYSLGRPGWQHDLRHGLAMARGADPLSYATVIAYAYFPGISFGVLSSTDAAVREIERGMKAAEQSSDDMAVTFARTALGTALVHRDTDAQRARGAQLLGETSQVFIHRGHSLSELPLVEAYSAREKARCGDRDVAVALMLAAADLPARSGPLLSWGYAVPATAVLAETLIDRGTDADLCRAEAIIERLATAPAEDGFVLRDVWVLRLRALLARARGDDPRCRDLVRHYRAMAESLGFEGHIAWAARM